MTAVFAPSRFLTAALAYAARGWRVFPCRAREKQPLVARGYLEATVDVATLTQWWTRWPEANIGLAPGASGLVVIDVDGPAGEAVAAGLSLYAEPTLSARTGRAEGGRHLFFQHPGFAVSNAGLGEKLDVRGDMGYVLIAPSVHPSGALYRWETRGVVAAVLPPLALAALQQAQTTGRPGKLGSRAPAAEIPSLESIADGGRNNTLTRYVGRLLAKGLTAVEAYETALALNDARCRPPLAIAEVWAIVQSLGAKELRKPERNTGTGAVLALAGEQAEADVDAPAFATMAQSQAEGAIARGRMDLSGAPRWTWPDLNRMVGAMLPGDLWVVGSLMGNGKTALLLSQMDAFAEARTPTLYLPLELDPEDLRRRWAAWKLGLDPVAVARNEWERLGEGAQDAHEAMIQEQAVNPYVHFPDERSMTLGRLLYWVERGVADFGAKIVVIDHFHRLDFGESGQQYRLQVSATVRRIKDVAATQGIVVLASAQLNQQEASLMDRYQPPQLRRLKETSAIAEEADVVLMLSRCLRRALTAEELGNVKTGLVSEREYAEANVMLVTCRKHRLDDAVAGDRSARLFVKNGRVESLEENREQPWGERTLPRADVDD